MRRQLWFLTGVLAAFVVLAIAGMAWISQARGFSARAQPSAIEAWVARRARDAALPREAAARKNPVADSPGILTEARAHWADHCAGCHANDGSGDTDLGRHTYPPAPDMRLPATQRLTDGELFYIIQNGVRLSAMPAWGSSAGDEEASWKLVRFIRHLPQLSIQERKEMEKLNPKGPQDRQEEEEEEKFLRGEELHETPTVHHHH